MNNGKKKKATALFGLKIVQRFLTDVLLGRVVFTDTTLFLK